MVESDVDVVVIGAGPAGLTAGLRLAQEGYSVLVIEASDAVGGFSRSIDILGGRVDLGPHRFFSSDRRINEFWLEVVGTDFVMVDRVTRILYDGNLFDYPLRPMNALKGLGLVESTRSILSYLAARSRSSDAPIDFEGWVTSRFGQRLYEIFFKTYSERLWGIPCTELDADFAAQRIKKFSLGAALKSAVRPSSGSSHKTLADRFAYPETGSGYLYQRMQEMLTDLGGRVQMRAAVTELITEQGRAVGVRTSDGTVVRAGQVISTMPLTQLVMSMSDVPLPVQNACSELKFRNTTLVYINVNTPSPFPDQWLYIHDPRVQMGRLTNFSNWSSSIGGEPGSTILCAEYWSNDDDDFWSLADEQLRLVVERDLELTGLVGRETFGSTHVQRLHRCYPVYKLGYRDHVEVIRQFVDQMPNLHVIGRYGSFKYNNQDHSILMGLLVVDNIVNGARRDLWKVNTDYDEYQESAQITESGIKFGSGD